MYLEHFGLNEAPFRITPHTEFFFAGANRGATLEALVYAVTHDEGIVKVSGEVGSGKTMLCRMLIARLPENVLSVYLATPSLSREEILYAIADELSVALPEGRMHILMRTLHERLLEIFAAGKRVVIIIDEAHAMPAETLEEIRLLSNLESDRHKLLQIVLFGQPELDERLMQREMRQLKERITHNFALEPLQRADTASYLMFRMRAAGYRGPDIFTQAAIRLISESSEGLTRRINILADKSLLAAFASERHQIDKSEVDAAIRDAQFTRMTPSPVNRRRWAGIAATIALVAATGVAILLARIGDKAPREPASQASTAPPPPENGAAPTPPPVQPQARDEDTGKSATTVAGSFATTTDNRPPRSTVASSAPQSAAVNTRGLGKLTTTTLLQSQSWLHDVPDSHFFIQLLNTEAGNSAPIESFLEGPARLLDQEQLRVYRSSLSGKDRLGIIYGEFRSRKEATAAIALLPPEIRAMQLHVRQVSRLK